MTSPIQKAIQQVATKPVQVDEEGEVACSFFFNPDFLGFSGHFPGNPILPAVIQIAIAQWMVEALPGKTCRVIRVDHAKFFEPVRPLTDVTVICSPQKEQNHYSCRMAVNATDKPVSTFTLICQSVAEAK